MNITKGKVLVIATGRKTRGGITSVIKAYEKAPIWSKYHCHWIQTHRDGTILRKLFYLLWAWIAFIIRLPFYNIVHIHFSLPNSAKRKYPFFKLAKAMKKKTVVHLHCGDQLQEIWNTTYEKMFLHADKVLFLSEKTKAFVAGRMGMRDNFEVLYNPCISIDTITPLSERENEILVAGTINKNKGYEDIIQAWAKIAPKYPDWRVIFAGNGEVDKASAIAAESKVEHQVAFIGWVNRDAKKRVFHRASALCMASYAEGFPMAVLDGFSYGLPIITSLVGGIGDIAKNGENMLLFDAGDIEKLAIQMERIVSDPNLRNSLAVASQQLSLTKFNIDTIARQLSDIYSTL